MMLVPAAGSFMIVLLLRSVVDMMMIVVVPAAPVMMMVIMMIAVRMTMSHKPSFKPKRPAAASGGQCGGHRQGFFNPAEMIAHGATLQSSYDCYFSPETGSSRKHYLTGKPAGTAFAGTARSSAASVSGPGTFAGPAPGCRPRFGSARKPYSSAPRPPAPFAPRRRHKGLN